MATTTSAPATKGAAGKDGAGKNGAGKDAAPEKGRKSRKSRKKVVIVALVVLLAGGGAYLKLGKATPAGAAPVPGVVLKLEPITLNLAEGHYLKLTMALQFTAAAAAGGHAGDKPDGSHALDIAIAQLSNRKVVELNSASARKQAKAELLKEVGKAYHQDVMDVYFTEFVMQ